MQAPWLIDIVCIGWMGVTNTAAARELSLLMVVLSADDVLVLYVCMCAQGEPPALQEANAPYFCVVFAAADVQACLNGRWMPCMYNFVCVVLCLVYHVCAVPFRIIFHASAQQCVAFGDLISACREGPASPLLYQHDTCPSLLYTSTDNVTRHSCCQPRIVRLPASMWPAYCMAVLTCPVAGC